MEQTPTKLLIPSLRPFYEWGEPVSWLLMRLTAGLMIIPHGWPKVMAGIGPTAASALAKRGIEVRLDWARVRVPAHVGTGHARDSAARRGTLLARSQAGSRALGR